MIFDFILLIRVRKIDAILVCARQGGEELLDTN
jgi:hypothetical protein